MAPKRKASKPQKTARERGPKRTKAMIQDNQWFAEGILGEDMRDGVLKYRVKWQGYPDDEMTWEEKKDISDDIFEEYQTARRQREDQEDQAQKPEEHEEQADRAEVEIAKIVKKRKALRMLPVEDEDAQELSTGVENAAAPPIEHESTDSSLSEPPENLELPTTAARASIAYSQSSVTTDAEFEYDDYFETPVAAPSAIQTAPPTGTEHDEDLAISPDEIEAVLGVDLGLGRFWEAS